MLAPSVQAQMHFSVLSTVRTQESVSTWQCYETAGEQALPESRCRRERVGLAKITCYYA